MGLVTCSKCKKIYDYDKYNGICPKCARYNKETTAAQEHQEYHDKYDDGYSHTDMDDHHSYHLRYDENQNPHGSTKKGSMDKKTKIILGVIVFFFLFNFIMPFFGILFIPIVIGLVFYFVKKNKK